MIKPILQQNKQNTPILGRHLRMPHPLAAKLWSACAAVLQNLRVSYEALQRFIKAL